MELSPLILKSSVFIWRSKEATKVLTYLFPCESKSYCVRIMIPKPDSYFTNKESIEIMVNVRGLSISKSKVTVD